MDFDNYKLLVDKYISQDWREVNFQRIVISLLEDILTNSNLSVVDVSQQSSRNESNIHTTRHYILNHIPDLIIVKDWNYANLNIPKSSYKAIIEVKSPVMDPLDKSSIHTDSEVTDYIKNNSLVILTDCYEWRFYNFDTIESIKLFEDGHWCDKNRFEELVDKLSNIGV